ncbi:uncharacterized protein LOC110028565 isoform X1 [Phalaenopsis equestris]|uniref:uncharacterized protein LOC110028565 isoform X1 n=1 Tax=Phalaenopsis equestris TaxID=78828 RepID=UPI0009E4C8ED|nr:uncharacterized protein LOC110028565 isoform X1 [Phalaenopsis equestris]
MASLALVHAQWSTALHHNRNKQVAVVRRKGIILSSTSHRFPTAFQRFPQRRFSCGFPIGAQERGNGDAAATHEENQLVRIVLQSSLWAAEAVYILWLFFLPYAPGDPVWAIKSNTVNDLMGLSLNFFLILPLANLVGIHVIEAPVLHPMAEGLFNLVIGWTFLFAPLLFTDHRRGRFRGSLDLLWGFQMFLTNTFLIPYMAIRLNNRSDNTDQSPLKSSKLGLLMTKGARSVGLIGGIVCFVSIIWAFLGRPESGFGDFDGRWRFLEHYIGSERLAYAFIWDIILYAVFQPWLIGDNLQNVRMSDQELVNVLRYMPVVGLVAYLLCLDDDSDL